MATIEGFERLRVKDIPELQTQAQLFRHEQTGAELLSLINATKTRFSGSPFGLLPKTPRGGSYPGAFGSVRVSQVPRQGTLRRTPERIAQDLSQRFHYPDKTCYPVASQNVQDFYNLIDVYLDAVFYPRINPFISSRKAGTWNWTTRKGNSATRAWC